MMKNLSYFMARVAFLSVALALQGVGMAAEVPTASNQLQAVDVTAQPGGRLDVQLQMSQPLAAAPVSFILSNPPRIVFDIPKTINATGKNVLPVNQGVLKSV